MKLTAEVLQMLRATARTRSLTYQRILWAALRKPRFTPGTLRFPFGRVRYVDAASVRTIFTQIFVDRMYDTEGLGAAPVILDCGGNIGLSVIAFKLRYPGARITVFEADPAIAATLADNVRTLKLANVEVVGAAVGAANGEAVFLPDGALGGRVASAATSTGPVGAAVTVPMVRLSERISGPVDLIKLDVEGSEFDVIGDLCRSARIAQVKMLICEVHGNPTAQPRFAELWEQLTDSGFQVALRDTRTAPGRTSSPFRVIRGDRWAVVLYAWRP
jgi:FkbM family methyltransferase